EYGLSFPLPLEPEISLRFGYAKQSRLKREVFLYNLVKERISLLENYGFAVSKRIEDISTYLEACP
ncbi:hypothetical protein, partial [Leptospira weilii]|uniref:hypothetical protein n=1 Tax=Leptospira weilii TaxID=28184 RepID=UPI001F3663C5